MPEMPHDTMPARSAVFALPCSVLFPNTLLPLQIFEPHYRLMLDDCLLGGGFITVVLLRKGSPKSLLDAPAYTVAGLGRVATVLRMPDATSRIFLGGVARVAIRRYTQRRPTRSRRSNRSPRPRSRRGSWTPPAGAPSPCSASSPAMPTRRRGTSSRASRGCPTPGPPPTSSPRASTSTRTPSSACSRPSTSRNGTTA